MMVTVKRIERGWPAHFCLAQNCLFRRNTLLKSDNGEAYVISTVGDLRDEKQPEKTIEIGFATYYETKAFPAKQDGLYIEADISNEINLCAFDPTFQVGIFAKTPEELQEMEEAFGVDNLANDVHEHAIDILTQKMEAIGKYETNRETV